MKAVIGALRAVLGMDTIAFEEGIGRAQKELSAFNKSFDRIGRNLERFGKTATVAVTAPVTALGALTLRAAANFEEGMNRVQAATGASGDELQRLNELARQIGRTTQFSASEAAGALEGLAKNGLNAKQILEGAADATVKLAQANGAQLDPAANVVTDVMAQFNKTAGDLGGVVDQVTGTLIASKLGFDDYRLAIGQAGGVAGKVGVTFEDFNAALAATSASFASGSDAGTSFKTFLTRMAPDSKQAIEAMKALGLSFFDSRGAMVSMEEAAGRLQKAFKPLSEEARIQFATSIFGTDAMRTALSLADAGAEGIRRFRGEIAKVDAGEQAAVRMKGFNGAVKELKAALEALAIAIGNSGLLQWATDFAKSLTGIVVAISQLNPEVLKFATIIAGLAAAVGPVAVTVGILMKSFGSLAVTLGRLAPAFAPLIALAAPWVALVAAVGAAVAAIALFSDKIPIAADGSIVLADALKAVMIELRSLSAWVADNVGVLGQVFDLSALDTLAPEIRKVFESITLAGMVESTAKELDAIIGLFNATANAVVEIWSTIGPAILDKVTQMASSVLKTLVEWTNEVIRIANVVGERLGRAPMKFLEAPGIGIAVGAWESAGARIAAAFEEGFAGRWAQNAIARMIDNTRRAAFERDPFGGLSPGETGGAPEVAGKPAPRKTGGGGTNPGGGGGGGSEGKKAVERLKEFLAENERAIELEKLSAQQRAISEALYKAENLAKEANIKLTLEERQQIERNVIALHQAKTATEEKQRLEQLAKQTIEDVKTSQEKYNDVLRDLSTLLQQGAISQDQFDKARKQALERMQSEGGTWSTQWQSFADAVTDASRGAAMDLLKMDGDVGDILGRLLQRIAQFALEVLVLQPIFDQIGKMIKGAFDTSGSGGGGSSILGMIASGIGSIAGAAGGAAGGSASGAIYSGPMASGGDVDVGNWYRINEMGTEAFVPNVPGTVLSARDLAEMGDAGGGTIVQNLNFSLGVAQTVRAEVRNLLPQIQQAATGAVEDARRRGGRFKGAFNA
jgi:TP901 family phage tail tape measure protein